MTIKCHFDGKAFIPEEPVNLPVGQVAHVSTEAAPRDVTIMAAAEGDGTVGDVLRSGAIGGWKHRADITDGRTFVDALRAARQERRMNE